MAAFPSEPKPAELGESITLSRASASRQGKYSKIAGLKEYFEGKVVTTSRDREKLPVLSHFHISG